MSISRFGVAATAILFVSGCGSGGGTPPPPTPASVTVSVTGSATLSSIGDTRPVTAVVRDANNAVISNASVSWTSSTPGAVTVSPATGLSTTATAAGDGSSNIRAQSGTVSGQTPLTVAQAFASLAVAPPTATISKTAPGNTTVQLTATPKDARGNNIAGLPAATFTSDNTAAATVGSSSGLVTAVDVGTAVITALLTSGTVTQTGTSTITVQSTPAGQTFDVTAAGVTFTPAALTITLADQVRWNFSNPHTVTFDGGPSPPPDIGTAANPQASGSVTRAFSVAGTYPYHCELHGTATTGMRGTIIVNP